MHPLIASLSQRVVAALGERMEMMFEGADDLLFGMGEKASSNADQRLYLDTMRVIRLERPRLAELFAGEIAGCFAPGYQPEGTGSGAGDVDFDRLALQDNDVLEQTIAVCNMEGKAEGLYRQPLWELERRLHWLVQTQGARVSLQALAPRGICNAVRRCLNALSVDLDIKLVIYKLFDRFVISDLGPLYHEALEMLREAGTQPAALPGDAPAARRPASPATAGTDPAAAHAPAWAGQAAVPGVLPPQFDGQTLSRLQYIAASGAAAGGAYYTDAMLASDLASVAAGRPPQGFDPWHSAAALQRADLVGRMFNDILADRQIPERMKLSLEQLRFPVIKTALTDSGFFSNPSHPVRSFVNELASMAAASRTSGRMSAEQIEHLVQQVREQFDLSAAAVRPAAEHAQPVATDDIERFLEEQLRAGEARRKAILDKARHVVAQEIEISTLGRRLPDAAQSLLDSGWAPMMGITLLRQGADSDRWRDGQALLRRVVTAVDPHISQQAREDAYAGLIDAFTLGLTGIGMKQPRMEALLHGFADAYQSLLDRSRAPAPANDALAMERLEDDLTALLASTGHGSAPAVQTPSTRAGHPPAPDPEPSAGPQPASLRPAPDSARAEAAMSAAPLKPTPSQLMDMLLTSGAWFRIYDRRRRDTRWLKVTAYRGDGGRVAFAEFDGNNVLTLDTTTLFEDLCSRRSEPIDPTPCAAAMLAHFIRAQATG
jgi:hypothetical protein